MKIKYVLLFFVLAAVSGFTSCKKTVGLDPLPQNQILEYKVSNISDTVIYGAIDQLDKTITVYVPYYYGLNLIDPKIVVSPGASLSEAILPVRLTELNQTYTVKAADGSTNTYKLVIVQQNTPSLSVSWSPSLSNPLSYPNYTLPAIYGDFRSQNGALATVELTHQRSGKVVSLSGGNIGIVRNGEPQYQLTGLTIPANIDTGYYGIKVAFLGHNAEVNKPVHIIHRQPDVLVPSRVAKQGESFTFTAFNSIFLNLKSVKVRLNGGSTYDLVIVSYTPTEMALRVPDNFPVGKYDYTAQYLFEFDTWRTVSKYGDLTINPK
ncbi:hypothetical protein J7E50_02815 [Pedobacter sp. ISL-68]|uniref:hypothetical protein n=1 Tax=unclassified Pedobacter TaxID=2628915 RepID=UPI001BE98B40|nr:MULTISPECIES: hypothetical protein [unclassified Pedobacter]MBT2560152.1 hypothetical protein [Pedobacter sp. ISL-64]MBT2589131.1 hypothetical protein [Pedobacter sp. ISL-68]